MELKNKYIAPDAEILKFKAAEALADQISFPDEVNPDDGDED